MVLGGGVEGWCSVVELGSGGWWCWLVVLAGGVGWC
jgi:hypothetical protein